MCRARASRLEFSYTRACVRGGGGMLCILVQISSTKRTCGADLINSQHIHVLVDICGLHANGTMLYRSILAKRPAGVQVAYEESSSRPASSPPYTSSFSSDSDE